MKTKAFLIRVGCAAGFAWATVFPAPAAAEYPE